MRTSTAVDLVLFIFSTNRPFSASEAIGWLLVLQVAIYCYPPVICSS